MPLLDSILQAAPLATLKSRPSTDHEAIEGLPGEVRPLCEWLKAKGGYDLLVDLTAVDWQAQTPRFSLYYHFYSTSKRIYLRLVVPCPTVGALAVPSIADIYPAANWHERETYDMFGIQFLGHPELKRILMWDSYPYHPLLKDFPLAGIETELPAADIREATAAKVEPAPMMGGPFRAPHRGTVRCREPLAKDESWTEHHPKPEDKG